jgi:hypothetical protein
LTGFLRKIATFWGAGNKTPARQILLAAFGKHPGWDDHVELGVESDRLVTVRRALYVEGIAANVDSGAWDALDPAQRRAGFDHVFLWTMPGGAIEVGRLWASRDGKGRDRYPMVVCADCLGVPLEWAVDHLYPDLQQIEEQCTHAADAATVTDVIRSHLQKLRDALPAAAPATNGHNINGNGSTDLASRLMSCPQLGPDGKGLMAVLYQLLRDVDAAGDPAAATASPDALADAVERHPVHLRVPACADTPAEAALLWIRFLQTRLGDRASLLALQSRSADWLDLIAGPPTSAHFFALRAAPAALPLTTDIPYQLDDDFRQRAHRLLELEK